MEYRKSGASALKLPIISLGLWQNFGDDVPFEQIRTICRTAYEAGVTHFDLANNYGPPPGSAERHFGRLLREDFHGLRDSMVISTKAGYPMWDGPYGNGGGKKYLVASLDQSLTRLGVDYVDIFYSHRFDPETPLEETMGTLDLMVRQGKALYVGISSYSASRTAEAAALLKATGTPFIIHQPSYSMLNRWIESQGLLDELERQGLGCIAFSPLAQGLLTDKYLGGVPAGSRADGGGSFPQRLLTDDALRRVRALNAIAARRGQTLAQMAIAWVLRSPRVTSALIGVSRLSQLEDSLGAIDNLAFSAEELAEIDEFAGDTDLNIWARSSAQ
jgi:L-glyceraldehyde 3-phosphate reductase